MGKKIKGVARMIICDICEKEKAKYKTVATISRNGRCQSVELCSKCYHILERKKNAALYLAYKKTKELQNG